MLVISYVVCICVYMPNVQYMAYMYNLGGIFVLSTYMTILCEVGVAVGCALVHICRILGIYGHAA